MRLYHRLFWRSNSQVDLQAQCSVQDRLAVEGLGTSVANIDISAVREDADLDKRLQPILDVATESASELLVRQQAAHSDTSVIVLALVQLPAGAVQVADSSLRAGSPADGKLTAGVLEPQHQLLGFGGG